MLSYCLSSPVQFRHKSHARPDGWPLMRQGGLQPHAALGDAAGRGPVPACFQHPFRADPRYCCAAALNPGFGAVRGAARKNEAWLDSIRLQGGTLIPICHKAGGRQGEQASGLRGKICMSAGGTLSDRTAFKVYASQRLHAVTFRGVAAVISARPIWRTGPGVFPGQAVSPRGPAPQRPTTGASCPGNLLRAYCSLQQVRG